MVQNTVELAWMEPWQPVPHLMPVAFTSAHLELEGSRGLGVEAGPSITLCLRGGGGCCKGQTWQGDVWSFNSATATLISWDPDRVSSPYATGPDLSPFPFTSPACPFPAGSVPTLGGEYGR